MQLEGRVEQPLVGLILLGRLGALLAALLLGVPVRLLLLLLFGVLLALVLLFGLGPEIFRVSLHMYNLQACTNHQVQVQTVSPRMHR